MRATWVKAAKVIAGSDSRNTPVRPGWAAFWWAGASPSGLARASPGPMEVLTWRPSSGGRAHPVSSRASRATSPICRIGIPLINRESSLSTSPRRPTCRHGLVAWKPRVVGGGESGGVPAERETGASGGPEWHNLVPFEQVVCRLIDREAFTVGAIPRKTLKFYPAGSITLNISAIGCLILGCRFIPCASTRRRSPSE